MRRPGFLGGFDEFLLPKAKLLANKSLRQPARRTMNGFGAFGKGFIAPPPNVPWGLVASPDAISKNGGVYLQDPRCPAGEKMTKKSETVPCNGPDCDPGEMEVEEFEECEDDSTYVGLEEPAGGFRNCAEREAARYPAPCNPNTCPTCFARAVSNTAAMQSELLKLQQEQQALQSMPTMPAQQPTAAYTGSPMPVDLPMNTAPRQATSEEQLTQLMEEHEEKKAITRASAPVPLYAPAPKPTVTAQKPTTVKSTNSLFDWLSSKLFGTSSRSDAESELDGFGDITSNGTKTIVAIIAIAGLYYSYTKMNSSQNLRSARKR